MWTQVVSSWGRLFGRREMAPDNQALSRERRVWVRYGCNYGTTCRPLHDTEDVRQSVQVQDISCGGIKLVGDQKVEAGTILSVELPGPTEGTTYTVLASVVNVNAQDQGKWALGCTFTQELSERDLKNFGAKRVPTSPSDQRNWERFPCASTVSYERINDPDALQQQARVLDLSPIGIGLLVTQPLEPGQLLQLDLFSSSGQSRAAILALVTRSSTQQENEWVVGCSFIRELNHQELKGLLDGSNSSLTTKNGGEITAGAGVLAHQMSE